MLLLAFAAVACAEWIDFGFDGLPSAEITVLESTPSGLVIELAVPGIEVNQIVQEGKVYHELSIPGTTPFASAEGYPSIPSLLNPVLPVLPLKKLCGQIWVFTPRLPCSLFHVTTPTILFHSQ